jgi:hypothetical protein
MTRIWVGLMLAGLMLTAACAPGDPLTGRAASDLPPGPLQPLPSESAPDTPDCRSLAVARGKTSSQSDADFLDITFTNGGDAPCMVHGYPTLTMRDGSGRNMGDRARLRSNGAARYIVLEPGEAATATVRYPKGVDGCKNGTARIEILIPAATERQYIDETHPYCPGWTVSDISRPWS